MSPLSSFIARLQKRIRQDFFLPETGLYYDHLSAVAGPERFAHLPTAIEIAAEFPNPCGWGTGMEDCALHAGSLIDSELLAGEAAFQRRPLEALVRLVTAHGHPGFVARGFSPVAGNHCYPNSSRDQFTLAVFGAWRYFSSAKNPSGRRDAAEVLKKISDFCERRVTSENHWNIGRLTGGPAMVSTLWDCAPHEMLRLPMIHAAAGAANHEPRKIELARRLLPQGIRRTLELDPNGFWWDISISQMQLSLFVLRELAVFPEGADDLELAMRRAAELAQREIDRLFDQAEAFTGTWGPPLHTWRDCPRRADVTPPEEGSRPYFNVRFPPDFGTSTELLRGIGNLTTSLALADALTPATVRRLESLLERLDIEHCCSGGIIQLLQGCCRAARRHHALPEMSNA